MSKIALALGSLTVGLVLGSMFQGSHTTTFAQSSNQPSEPPAFNAGIEVPGAIPVVPGLAGTRLDNVVGAGRIKEQQLDGLNCRGCVINADVITYGGGAYSCELCKLKADKVVLKGAALNTVVLLKQVTALLNTPESSNPNKPTIMVADNKKNATLTFVSEVK